MSFRDLHIDDIGVTAKESSSEAVLEVLKDFVSNMSDLMVNNSTLPPLTSKQHTTLKLYDIFIPLIGCISILLNFAVVISSGLILKKGQQPKSTYLFLGNVAMTDLITSISVIFGQMYPKDYREHYVCTIQLGMIVSSTLASVFSVGLIALDRYLYILHGLQYTRWVYPGRARLSIAFCWLVGLIVGFLPLFGWYGDTNNGKQCWFIKLAPQGLIVLTVSLGGIPILLVVLLYSLILYHALKNIYRLKKAREGELTGDNAEKGLRIFRGKVNNTEEEEVSVPKEKRTFKRIFMSRPSDKVKGSAKWKAIKVVMFTSGSFLFTWGPYFIVSLIFVYTKDAAFAKSLSFLIASPLAILGFLNTLINPIIYAWWHKGFRSFIKQKFNFAKKKKLVVSSSNTMSSKQTASTSSSRKVSNSSVSGEVVQIEPLPSNSESS